MNNTKENKLISEMTKQEYADFIASRIHDGSDVLRSSCLLIYITSVISDLVKKERRSSAIDLLMDCGSRRVDISTIVAILKRENEKHNIKTNDLIQRYGGTEYGLIKQIASAAGLRLRLWKSTQWFGDAEFISDQIRDIFTPIIYIIGYALVTFTGFELLGGPKNSEAAFILVIIFLFSMVIAANAASFLFKYLKHVFNS